MMVLVVLPLLEMGQKLVLGSEWQLAVREQPVLLLVLMLLV
jgi:hypothetical protein